MGLFGKTPPAVRAAKIRLTRAQQALDANQRRDLRNGNREETADYLRLNTRVCNADRDLRAARRDARRRAQ